MWFEFCYRLGPRHWGPSRWFCLTHQEVWKVELSCISRLSSGTICFYFLGFWAPIYLLSPAGMYTYVYIYIYTHVFPQVCSTACKQTEALRASCLILFQAGAAKDKASKHGSTPLFAAGLPLGNVSQITISI